MYYLLLYRRRALQREREEQRLEKERHAQAQYMQKLQEQAERKRQAEGMISQLEREERQLIDRLRQTQSLQEQVLATVEVFP